MRAPHASLGLILIAAAGLPRLAGAQSCDLLTTFDPNPTTTVVGGDTFIPGWAVFRSPENADPTLVWYVGDPGTLDGCVGGIAPGSGAPTGRLEIVIDALICFGVDVRTSAPYTAELFDPDGVLLSSLTGASPSYDLPFRSATWVGHRVLLTPGTLPGGGREGLCVDNARAVYVGLPVRTRTWGTVKTLYR